MTFSVKRFFESDVRDDRVETEIRNERFQIRPLSSTECSEYAEIEGKTERAFYLLKHGLCGGEKAGELTESDLRRLIAENELLAVELAGRIAELTSEIGREEEERWKDAKKKLERDPYIYLHRAYCRKYQIEPSICRVTKSELIEDAAFDAVLPPKPGKGGGEIQAGLPAKLFFTALKERFVR